ncbi:unnamed protein product [Enterobius vermicularis]|uniref:Adenylate kinase n=1 Tax=Enterobius vermicularis TaxID=51028 RepID=A0A0N4V7E3_ENTVE|nr:unnamed protein product [Enterobius vermicularis]
MSITEEELLVKNLRDVAAVAAADRNSSFDSSTAIIFGISGCTNAGKTTLAKHMAKMVNWDKLVDDVKKARRNDDFIIIEGNMLTDAPEILQLLHRMIFLMLDREICFERRSQRTDYDPPDKPGYFEEFVWPSYERCLKTASLLARESLRFGVVDGISQAQAPDLQCFLGGETNDCTIYSTLQKLCCKTKAKFESVDRIVIIQRIGRIEKGDPYILVGTRGSSGNEARLANKYVQTKQQLTIWKMAKSTDESLTDEENLVVGKLHKSTIQNNTAAAVIGTTSAQKAYQNLNGKVTVAAVSWSKNKP